MPRKHDGCDCCRGCAMKEQDFIFFEQQRHASDSLLPLVPSRDKQTHTNLSGFPKSASQVRGRRLQYSLRGHPYKCATWLRLYLKKAKILGASAKAQTPVCAMIRVKISCVKSGVFMCGCPLPGDVRRRKTWFWFVVIFPPSGTAAARRLK